jgi:glycosyltransferase involved in cell wall biosynthesis
MCVDVSVIVCTRNRADVMPVLLESLETMVVPDGLAWEILVVDNASTDDTPRVAKEWSARLPLRYIHEGRIGKSHALNTGIEKACGKVLAFLDDDAWVDRGWLAAVWTASLREGFSHGGGPVVAVWKCKPPRWMALGGPYKVPCAVVERAETPKFSPGGVLFILREVAIRNGPYRVDLGPGASGASEDTEYCMRLRQRGLRPAFVPEARIFHPVEARRLTRAYLVRWRSACGRSEMRWRGVPMGTACILGVPRFLLRREVESLILWWLSFESKKRFYYRCRYAYTLGEILESFRNRGSRVSPTANGFAGSNVAGGGR